MVPADGSSGAGGWKSEPGCSLEPRISFHLEADPSLIAGLLQTRREGWMTDRLPPRLRLSFPEPRRMKVAGFCLCFFLLSQLRVTAHLCSDFPAPFPHLLPAFFRRRRRHRCCCCYKRPLLREEIGN